MLSVKRQQENNIKNRSIYGSFFQATPLLRSCLYCLTATVSAALNFFILVLLQAVPRENKVFPLALAGLPHDFVHNKQTQLSFAAEKTFVLKENRKFLKLDSFRRLLEETDGPFSNSHNEQSQLWSFRIPQKRRPQTTYTFFVRNWLIRN